MVIGPFRCFTLSWFQLSGGLGLAEVFIRDPGSSGPREPVLFHLHAVVLRLQKLLVQEVKMHELEETRRALASALQVFLFY